MMQGKLLVLAASLFVFTADVVTAQQGGFGRFGRGITAGRTNLLVDIPEVRRELGIKPLQEKLLDDLQTDLVEQRQAVIVGASEDAPDAEGLGFDELLRARFDRIGKRLRTFDRHSEALVSIVLEPLQAKRLRELRVQREGWRSLAQPEVAAALKLTDEQSAQVGEILKAAQPAAGTAEFFRRRRELPDEQKAHLRELLTEDQQQAWEKLKGAPFEFPTRRRFGREFPRPGQD